MALKTDYRVVDDAGDFDDDAPAIVINQDGSEVCIPLSMIDDVLLAIEQIKRG